VSRRRREAGAIVTIAASVHAAIRRLTAAGVPIDEARRDAALLARAVLGWDAAQWIARQQDEAAAGFTPAFTALIDRRARREPVAYITGEREFYGRWFRVTPAVLIPRPETELLVDETLAALRAPDGPAAPLVVDAGTGSGCIAISIALEHPSARVVGTDVCGDALAIARQNASRLGARVELRQGSLLAGLTAAPDAIVSNPPYVSESDRPSLPPEVRDYEPGPALFAGLDGLDVVRELVRAAASALAPGGWLLMEVGAGQAPHVARLIGATPPLRLERVRLDLQSIARVVSARRMGRMGTSR
jgi:release factor glutamine methyltransferase